jgi:kelch-like protein 2/3
VQANSITTERIQSGTGLALYTDGSKDPVSGTVGAAYTDAHNFIQAGFRLPNGTDVYTAEMYAVLKAIERFYGLQAPSLTIYSDSLSTLKSISTGKTQTRPTLLKQILVLLHSLENKSRQVKFVWIPSHIGIKGNDLADIKANYSRTLATSVDLPPTLNQIMKQVTEIQIAKWQSHWDHSDKGRNLYRIQPIVNIPACYSGLTRREQGWIARIRSSHVNLAATRHYKGNAIHPFCNYCLHHLDDAIEETVDHFLMDCPKYNCRARLMECGDYDSTPITLLKKAAEDSPTGLNARNALTSYLRQTSKINI